MSPSVGLRDEPEDTVDGAALQARCGGNQATRHPRLALGAGALAFMFLISACSTLPHRQPGAAVSQTVGSTPTSAGPSSPGPAPVSTGPASHPPSPAPWPGVNPVQVASSPAAVPPSWVGAAATVGELELELHLPRRHYTVGERAPAILVLRNAGANPLDLTLPCGQYFQLVVRDDSGREVFNWTRETYGPVMPPCPRGERRLAPGESVQVTLHFPVPTAGRLRVGGARFGQTNPIVELEISANNP
jgi:hypothetical protein